MAMDYTILVHSNQIAVLCVVLEGILEGILLFNSEDLLRLQEREAEYILDRSLIHKVFCFFLIFTGVL